MPLGAKRRRLVAIGIPHAKLVEVIKRLRDYPIDEPVTRGRLQHSLDDLWAATGCQLKLQSSGGEISWDLLSLPKTLQMFVSQCSSFQQILRELFLRRPCTPNDPYNLVVYADEVQRQTGFECNGQLKKVNASSL